MPLIYICGSPGSGKSTLAEKIKRQYPKVDIIDIDKCRDEVLDEGIKGKSKFASLVKKNNIRMASELFTKEVRKKINKAVGDSKAENIVVVGVFRDFDYEIDRGYMIKIPLDRLYRQLFTRELDKLYKNYGAVKRAIDNTELEMITAKVELVSGSRVPFILEVPEVKDRMEYEENLARKNKFKIMPPDEILKDIKKYLKN